MKIKLKNGSEYNVTNVTQTKNSSLWFFSFVITDSVTTEELDKEFTNDNITALTLISDDETETEVSRYNHTDRLTISYGINGMRTAVQLSVRAENEEE